MRNITITISLLLAGTFAVAAQDTVTFKSGKSVEVDVVRYDDGKITLKKQNGETTTGSIEKIDTIEFSTASQDAEQQEVSENQQDSEKRLQGEDLNAWKLARNGARDYCYGDNLDTLLEDESKPIAGNMEKTDTGDWKFRFIHERITTFRSGETYIVTQELIVEVIDLGTEYQVGEIETGETLEKEKREK